jgi:hypothetical protein
MFQVPAGCSGLNWPMARHVVTDSRETRPTHGPVRNKTNLKFRDFKRACSGQLQIRERESERGTRIPGSGGVVSSTA